MQNDRTKDIRITLSSKALFAKNPDSYEDLVEAARKMATKLSSKRERLFDLTLPIVSYFNGSRFNDGIKECIGATTKINELILNFFCVSTDLCRSAQVIHTKGLCWKYLRASMSLHGYLVSIDSNSTGEQEYRSIRFVDGAVLTTCNLASNSRTRSVAC